MSQEKRKSFINIDNLNKINSINASFLQDVLQNYFNRSVCVVQDFKYYTLSGGFDANITGGGLFLFVLDGHIDNKPAPSIVLKVIPSFKNGQQAVIEKLQKLGHLVLANLLKKFPSNKIGEREVMSYLYLPSKISLRIPILYYSRVNTNSGSAWLFLEDLSSHQFFSAKDSHWTKNRLRSVLRQMAAFHSVFWGKTTALANQTWLGRWWSEQKSDYVSPEIAQYMLDACAKLHPTILTNSRRRLLNVAVKIRPKLHKEFTKEPQTIIHWDFNPSNICFDGSALPARRLILFDWQTTSVGLPQWDIAQLLIPCLDITKAKLVDSLIKDYVSFLPLSIQLTLDFDKFYRLFDLVVLDHFFRVCWPILLSGDKIETDDVYFLEWKHALNWIENRSAKWLSSFNY
jgi:hypothetical protein